MTAQQQITENLPALPEITQDQWPAIYEGGDYLNDFIQRVRGEVTSEVPDLTTVKGRKRVASLAAQVSSAKAAVEKPGREYLKVIKAKPKLIEENLREFVRSMDALRDEVRAPLNQWEAEQARIAAEIDRRITDIKSIASNIDGANAEQLRKWLENSDQIEIDETLGDRQGEAAAALVLTQKTLRDALARREAFEAEQAALEKQRLEQEAERQRLERERIEREAEERARIAAEEKARKDAEESQRREIEARMAQERAEREAEAAKQREAEAKAKAAEQAERAAQAAAEAERQRIADEQAAQAAEEKRRQEDQEHRGTINREAKADLVALGLDDETAKQILIAIITGTVRHVSVRY